MQKDILEHLHVILARMLLVYKDRIVALDKKYSNKEDLIIAIMPNDTNIKPDDNLDAMKQRAKEKVTKAAINCSIKVLKSNNNLNY